MTLAPSEMICFALYSAGHAMQQAYRPHLDALGLTYPQYIVLSALWTAPAPPTVGGISAQVHLDSSTLTPLLKRLEAMGLVTRTRDRHDERQVRVGLTATGRAMEASAAHIPACFTAKTGLTMYQIVQMRADLARLADQLRAPDAVT